MIRIYIKSVVILRPFRVGRNYERYIQTFSVHGLINVWVARLWVALALFVMHFADVNTKLKKVSGLRTSKS